VVEINSASVKGEPGTGFEKRAGKGPFECGNCEYFKEGCTQKDMKKLSKQPRLPNGNVDVDADDCCEYVERKSKGVQGVAGALGRARKHAS
jgi:hypothetical protein